MTPDVDQSESTPILELTDLEITPNIITSTQQTPQDIEIKITPTPTPSQVPTITESTDSFSLDRVSVFGLQPKKTNLSQIYEDIQQLNPHWFRKNGVIWSDVEPEEGDRDWYAVSLLDSELTIASQLGMETILIVRSTPEWAQLKNGFYCGPIREDKFVAFGNFMYDLVTRYSQPPYNVRYWEIWNEPDANINNPMLGFGCWADPNDDYYGGSYYAEMLKMIYPLIKSADPKAQVIIGGLLLDCDPVNPPDTLPGSGIPKDCKSSKFLEGILINDGGEFFDGIGFHAYDYYYGVKDQYGNFNWHSDWNSTGPVTINKANYIRDLLNRYGYQEKYLLNTEAALLCVDCQENDSEFESTKANYIAQLYAIAIAENYLANVWFSYTGWRNSGLVASDFSPRLAYSTYRIAQKMLGNSVFIREVNQDVRGYVFDRGDNHISIYWSMDGIKHAFTLPENTISVWNVFGEQLFAGSVIEIGADPVYIETAP
jgi:hypothetical protein